MSYLLPAFCACAIFFSLLSNSSANQILSDAERLQLDQKIKEELHKQGSPGIGYAVTYQGKVVHMGAMGFADVEKNTPFQIDTRTSIGSISKTFTSLAVYHLIDQVKGFDLSTPVVEVLPWLRKDLHDITIGQLLSHTSGLQRSVGGDSIANFDKIYQGWYSPPYEDVPKIMKNVERLYSKPDIMPQYSNLAYSLLGLVIEKVAEQSGFPFVAKKHSERIAEFMRARVINSMGLSDHVDLMVESRDPSKEAQPYGALFGKPAEDVWAHRYLWRPIEDLGMALTHSGVVSDVEGLAKFALVIEKMTQSEEFPEKSVISKAQFDQLSQIVARSYGEKEAASTYGNGKGALLFEKLKTDSREFIAVGHTGTGYGSRAFMYVDPKTSVGVALVINDKVSNRHNYGKILFDAVFAKIGSKSDVTLAQQFSKNYEHAVEFMNAEVALSGEQKALFPNVSKDEPLYLKGLMNYFIKIKGLTAQRAKNAVQSLQKTEFVTAAFGDGWTTQFLFEDMDGNQVSEPFKHKGEVVVKATRGGKTVDLLFDPDPKPAQSFIMEGFSPNFVAFSFFQWDFDLDDSGKVKYLVRDNTFFLKARPRTQQGVAPMDAFPQAKKLSADYFPGGKKAEVTPVEDVCGNACQVQRVNEFRDQKLEKAIYKVFEACAANQDKQELLKCEVKGFSEIDTGTTQAIFYKNVARNESRILIVPQTSDGSFYDLFYAPDRKVQGSGYYSRNADKQTYRLFGNTAHSAEAKTQVNSELPANRVLVGAMDTVGGLSFPTVKKSRLGVLGSPSYVDVDIIFSKKECQLKGVQVQTDENGIKKDSDFERSYQFQSVIGSK